MASIANSSEMRFTAKPISHGYRIRNLKELTGERGKLYSLDEKTGKKSDIEVEIYCSKTLQKGLVQVDVVSPSSRKKHKTYELLKSCTVANFDCRKRCNSTSVRFDNLRICKKNSGKSSKTDTKDEGKAMLKFSGYLTDSDGKIVPLPDLYSDVIYDTNCKEYRKPNIKGFAPDSCLMLGGSKVIIVVAEKVPETVKVHLVWKNDSGDQKWQKFVDCTLLTPTSMEAVIPPFDIEDIASESVQVEMSLWIDVGDSETVTSNVKIFEYRRFCQCHANSAMNTVQPDRPTKRKLSVPNSRRWKLKRQSSVTQCDWDVGTASDTLTVMPRPPGESQDKQEINVLLPAADVFLETCRQETFEDVHSDDTKKVFQYPVLSQPACFAKKPPNQSDRAFLPVDNGCASEKAEARLEHSVPEVTSAQPADSSSKLVTDSMEQELTVPTNVQPGDCFPTTVSKLREQSSVVPTVKELNFGFSTHVTDFGVETVSVPSDTQPIDFSCATITASSEQDSSVPLNKQPNNCLLAKVTDSSKQEMEQLNSQISDMEINIIHEDHDFGIGLEMESQLEQRATSVSCVDVECRTGVGTAESNRPFKEDSLKHMLPLKCVKEKRPHSLFLHSKPPAQSGVLSLHPNKMPTVTASVSRNDQYRNRKKLTTGNRFRKTKEFPVNDSSQVPSSSNVGLKASSQLLYPVVQPPPYDNRSPAVCEEPPGRFGEEWRHEDYQNLFPNDEYRIMGDTSASEPGAMISEELLPCTLLSSGGWEFLEKETKAFIESTWEFEIDQD